MLVINIIEKNANTEIAVSIWQELNDIFLLSMQLSFLQHRKGPPYTRDCPGTSASSSLSSSHSFTLSPNSTYSMEDTALI
jgi:hypothetical protein